MIVTKLTLETWCKKSRLLVKSQQAAVIYCLTVFNWMVQPMMESAPDEGDNKAGKEVVIQERGWDLQTGVFEMVLEVVGKKVLLSGQVHFCRLASSGLSDFACNSAYKMYETSSAPG